MIFCMHVASSLVYVVAALRGMARDQTKEPTEEGYKNYDLKDPEKLLTLPLTATETVEFVMTNKDSLIKAKDFDGDDVDTLKALEVVISRQGGVSEAVLQTFGDEFDKKELVYAITVDESLKRVTVTFRGSTTKTDWLTDFQIWMEEVDNPLRNHFDDVPEKISLHNGFHGKHVVFPIITFI